ncbi:MAG TPA: ABC transporter ATP-binding protein [Acidimicrobiales bacterium]|jgi:ATP-binding cassette, subfamily B, bacterial|nr:ABC transporter ATP-binding protein [Acidimicrobiales bacterium]
MADLSVDKARLVRALWHMASLAFRADPLRAVGAIVCSVAQSTGLLITAFLVSRVIGAIVDGDGDRAVRLAVATGVIASVATVTSLARLDLRFRMEESTGLLIDRELIELSARIPTLEYHERPEHLDRLELLRSQKEALSGSIGALIENFAVVGSVVTTAMLLVSVHPALALLPLFGVPTIVLSAKIRAWWQKVEEATAERLRLSDHLYELSTTGPPAKELRVFGLQPEIESRFDSLVESLDAEFNRLNVRATLMSTFGWVLFGLGYVSAVGYVALRALDGEAGPEDVVLVVSLAAQVNQQVNSVYWMVAWLFDTLKTTSRYLRLVDDARAATAEVAEPLAAPDRLETGIRIEGLSFRYPGTDVEVLRNVDLSIPAGATVAVVGENGAGKTTLMKLLARFYDPAAGVITVDGIDLSRIPPGEWRARMSAGFQDFAQFELVARENVGVGDLPAIDDLGAVQDALKRASAEAVAEQLPDGLETQLGRSFEGGTELSGGQWQKLALGRAMMRATPLLLVLDEPTAALDADTEHALFERYAGTARQVARANGAITILVSHRFSTVRMADLIVVVGDQGITEVGSHAELMERGGVYAELYALQARAYL